MFMAIAIIMILFKPTTLPKESSYLSKVFCWNWKTNSKNNLRNHINIKQGKLQLMVPHANILMEYLTISTSTESSSTQSFKNKNGTAHAYNIVTYFCIGWQYNIHDRPCWVDIVIQLFARSDFCGRQKNKHDSLQRDWRCYCSIHWHQEKYPEIRISGGLHVVKLFVIVRIVCLGLPRISIQDSNNFTQEYC